MSAIRNIPIGRKFVIAFGIVCVLCLVLGTYTFFTFLSIAQIHRRREPEQFSPRSFVSGQRSRRTERSATRRS